MKLIERYIFQRAGIAVLVTLSSLVGVVWIIQALKELDVFTTKGQTVVAYLALTTLAIPMLILAVIPIALLLATIYAVNSLNANSELVVINASGASSWVLVKPLLVLALMCSMFTGMVGHFVSPWSLLTLKVLATEMRADLVQVIVREGTFTKIEDGLVFHVAKREAGGVLRGILISDERDKEKSIVFTADTGFVKRQKEGAVLLLRDGEIQQRNPESNSVTVINYNSYVFDLSTLATKVGIGKIRPKERTTIDLLNPDPEDPYYQKRPGLYRSQIHERFSEMLWPFTYVIVMLAFAGQARSTRQGHGSAIGAAMLVVTILRGVGFSAIAATKGDASIVWLVYALPLSGILLGSWFLVTGRPVELSPSAQMRVDAANAAIATRIDAVMDRILKTRRRAAGVRA